MEIFLPFYFLFGDDEPNTYAKSSVLLVIGSMEQKDFTGISIVENPFTNYCVKKIILNQ